MEFTLKYLEDSKNRKVFDHWSNTFVVYLITNIKNGKFYVGITKHIKIRIHEHIRYSKNEYSVSMYLHKSIRKHGLDSYTIKILDVGKNYNELNNLEIKYIKKFKANDSEYGYNLTSGGNAGIPNDITTLKKIKSSKKIKVGQYDLNGKLIRVYESIMEASRILNIKNSDIHRCCKMHWTRNGYMFYKSNIKIPKKIKSFKSKRGLNFKGKSPQPHNAISCGIKNKTTKEIFIAESIIELSKKSGVSKDTIFRIKKNKHKKYEFFFR